MKYGVYFLLCFVLLISNGISAEAKMKVPEVSAKSAILIDVESNRVLYEKNSDEKRLIASITKLMTALVAVESQRDIKQIVKIKEEWTNIEGSSIYLKPFEEVTLETLLYGLLLRSGNDAAVAVAGFCGGDVETFVNWMNDRAVDLNMSNSSFRNPNGLNHDEHYSTAADMAKLAACVLKNEILANIVSTKSIVFEDRNFTNSNKLLWRYEGCIGMKTGYTEKAGRTLVSAAQRDGHTLVVVTLSAPNDWCDHMELFEYGFSSFQNEELVSKGEELTKIRVEDSFVRSVPLYADETICYPLKDGDQPEVTINIADFVHAPVKQDGIAGNVEVYVNDELIGVSYLRYCNGVEQNTVLANHSIRKLFEMFEDEYQFYLPKRNQNTEAT